MSMKRYLFISRALLPGGAMNHPAAGRSTKRPFGPEPVESLQVERLKAEGPFDIAHGLELAERLSTGYRELSSYKIASRFYITRLRRS
jgi:hypothetical protein